MGLFDGGKSEQLKYLDEERKKIWERLTRIENTLKIFQTEINRKADSETVQSAKKAAEFRNRTEDRLREASEIVGQLKNESISVKGIKSEIDGYRNDIKEIKQSFVEQDGSYKLAHESLTLKIEKLEAFINEYPDLDEELMKVDEFIKGLDENFKKSSITLSSINKRKSEIDDIHREIFGYEEKNEDDEITKIEGLKDELEKTYETLKNDLTESLETVENLNSEYKNKFAEFEKSHKDSYEKITAEIRSLLPNALTAGLSAAFSKKKEDEVLSSVDLQKNFRNGIYLLLGVSLIPFITGIIFLIKGIAFEEVIMKLPRLVLSIIPMYIPVLWFTYSANKKLNLSKRLIEEYAHKEVLSRTYEGLSAQIAGVVDEEHSNELKYRLLANFLQVSSENPGKLISNYEASDHPIMEALEQSYKFQIAIDKLEGIPGMAKVAAFLEKKTKSKLEARKKKTEMSFAEGDEINDEA